MVKAAGLAALVSGLDAERLAPSERDLWQHERVVEGLMAGFDVVPARFGSVLRGDSDVRELLLSREDELRATLCAVGGALELGVRAHTQETPESPREGASGTEYLGALRRRHDRAALLAAEVDERLAPLSRDRRLRTSISPSISIKAAYLVPTQKIGSFRDRVASLSERSGVAFSCTGPWPPYSFVGVVGEMQ